MVVARPSAVHGNSEVNHSLEPSRPDPDTQASASRGSRRKTLEPTSVPLSGSTSSRWPGGTSGPAWDRSSSVPILTCGRRPPVGGPRLLENCIASTSIEQVFKRRRANGGCLGA